MTVRPSKYSLGEEIAHAITHGVGAGLAIAGLAVLMVAAATRGSGEDHLGLRALRQGEDVVTVVDR